MNNNYETIDVRKATSNFLPGLLKKASRIDLNKGLCVIQTFEPKPLFSAMKDIGFDVKVEKISDTEYHCYFTRTEIKEIQYKNGSDMPLKPTAILNYKKIDNNLANIAINFWEETWNKKSPAIELKTKLLLSLSNAVGANRFRQATRELIKAYSLGVSIKEFDELFSLFVWNQGFGNFSSEIGPSSTYKAYQYIKKNEEINVPQNVIIEGLMDKFGENNKEVSTSL
ncbi:MAG: hypothetical protein PQJ44_09440 [Sphaerochaetaceae bacterium]|nr:hypothetical protein [Sphaerochaetaceae bacterium]